MKRKHKINILLGTTPSHSKMCRFPKCRELELRDQIDKQKSDGIIRDSEYPWNSPV